MMNKLLAAAAALLFTACLDTDAPIDGAGSEPSIEIKTDDSIPSLRDQPREPSKCDQIVETDGPCAVACDPLALQPFIPNGTCATFLCTLEDGSEFRTGGCNR